MGSLIKGILKTSEGWGIIISGVGEAIVHSGLMTQDDYNKALVPLLTYIVMRIISKTAKATVK